MFSSLFQLLPVLPTGCSGLPLPSGPATSSSAMNISPWPTYRTPSLPSSSSSTSSPPRLLPSFPAHWPNGASLWRTSSTVSSSPVSGFVGGGGGVGGWGWLHAKCRVRRRDASLRRTSSTISSSRVTVFLFFSFSSFFYSFLCRCVCVCVCVCACVCVCVCVEGGVGGGVTCEYNRVHCCDRALQVCHVLQRVHSLSSSRVSGLCFAGGGVCMGQGWGE